MALQRVKSEMHGDTSRWGKRDWAKRAAKKQRRRDDGLAVTHGGCSEVLDIDELNIRMQEQLAEFAEVFNE